MTGLRVVLVLLVVAMLAQPVLSWELTEQVTRRVAVLVDTSASMTVRDAPSDGEADRSRLGKAVDLLLGGPGQDEGAAPGLLAKLGARYRVNVYEFARQCDQGDPASLEVAAQAAALTVGPSSMDSSEDASIELIALGEGGQTTDFTSAIDKVLADADGGELAGIVLLTDGRHNAVEAPEPKAAKLGLARTPIFPIVMAPDEPPCDAAVLEIEAPQTVMAGDRLLVRAELKLDGLAGRTVEVSLLDGARQAASQRLRVPTNRSTWRPRVLLRDEPKGESLKSYRVRIAPQSGEAFIENNSRPLTVSVTRRKTRLLLIDDRPRWEFRYLRNLFDGRDPAVRLQYVLLRPDSVAGTPRRKPVHASAVRSARESRATSLPASPDEWMKFDVIVLGDVAPQAMEPWQLDTLRRFVVDRGGTLIVVAGPNAMPHAWRGTPLANVLPVRIQRRGDPARDGLADGVRIALTTEGRNHPVMLQSAAGPLGEEAWRSVPPIYWRHPGVEAKPGATVLAYAANKAPSPPPPATAQGDAAAIRRQQARQREIERRNPLVVLHQVSAGRVAAVCFDSTWRLRYRFGDARHHTFWGQVVRWATAQRLRGGSDHVRFGPERTRYEPGESVHVLARIVRRDLSPVLSRDVVVKVFREQKLLMTRRMEYQPASAGMYEADLGMLPGGAYTVQLDAPQAQPLLAADGIETATAEFAVDETGPAELLVLSADRGLLKRLAGLSGGEVFDPQTADQLIDRLGPPSVTTRRRQELRLWDSWPVLMLIVVLAGTEWLLRKRNGLC